jgi:ABC-type polysaccharide transport system permease subunit
MKKLNNKPIEKKMNNTIELFAYTLFFAGIVGIIFAISLRWFISKDSKKK